MSTIFENKCPPHKIKTSGSIIYGSQRLKLALHIIKILNEYNIGWYIEGGTLLGAYRNNKLIPHDDDFDIALLYDKNAIDSIQQDFKKINNKLNQSYTSRLINSYTHKIEVYDSSYGKYILQGDRYNGADFHHVTVDLQAYELDNSYYKSLYKTSNLKHAIKNLFPLREIILEDKYFQAPNNIEKVLTDEYGSLDENAVYNESTEKYEL
jgi:phosphorylcholine metabolism protein LicD